MKNIGIKVIIICTITLIVVGTFTSTIIAKEEKKAKKQTVYVVTEKQSKDTCKIMNYDETNVSTYKYNKNGLLKNVDINYVSWGDLRTKKYDFTYKGKEVVKVKITDRGATDSRKLIKKWYYNNSGLPKEISVVNGQSDKLSFNKNGNLKLIKRTYKLSDGSKGLDKDVYSYDIGGNLKKCIYSTSTFGKTNFENHEYICDEKGNITFERYGYGKDVYSKNCKHTLTYNEQGLLATRYTIDDGNTYGDPGEGDPFDPRYIIDVNQNYTYKSLRVDKKYVNIIKRQQWEILNNLGILYLREY